MSDRSDDDDLLTSLLKGAGASGAELVRVNTCETALRIAADRTFDVLWLDVELSGVATSRRLSSLNPGAKVVAIETGSSPAAAWGPHLVALLRRPLLGAQIEVTLRSVIAARRADRLANAPPARLAGDDPGRAAVEDWSTDCPPQIRAVELARQVAPTQTPVLICGERGTGKGRLARAVHQWSDRVDGGLQTLRCGSGSAEALEEQWFGLAAEAGSGHPPDVVGRLDNCHGATLLLDEITALPLPIQLKFERLLSEGQYERRDDFTVRHADVRVIATSSVDPQHAVVQGRLRPELLAALDVVRIDLPPLRDRPQDLDRLSRQYLATLSRRWCGGPISLTPELLAVLGRYAWPGNQRELRNLIERAALLRDGDSIGLQHFPCDFGHAHPRPGCAPGDLVPLETIEDQHIRGVVAATLTIKQAAQVLGINYSTLWRRLRKHPIDAPLRLPPVEFEKETG